MSAYLDVVKDVYAEAAREPDLGLCCTSSPAWSLPGLVVPPPMLAMNYGCGSAIDPRGLRTDDTVVYVGVGGGLEALQLAYWIRRPGGVVAVDPVAEMRERAAENFAAAARLNSWFRPEFVKLVDGNALELPLANQTATIVAQNCLFNIFREQELRQALAEAARVLTLGGRLFTADPVTSRTLPESLQRDDRLRARCVSGCQTFDGYLRFLTDAGFGRVEVRARVPYRVLCPAEYPVLSEPVLLESLEAVAYKQPEGPDGPMIFTGRTAVYVGRHESLDAGDGAMLSRGVPMPVSDAAAKRLGRLADVLITGPTYHANGSGCC